MKKAKVFLTIVVTIGITGGALAYKATRILNVFYIDTVTTTVGGIFYSVCTVPTYYQYLFSPGGVRTIKASTAPTDMTCPVISVIPYG